MRIVVKSAVMSITVAVVATLAANGYAANRVETIGGQCYRFTADAPAGCDSKKTSSTWLVERVKDNNPCDVKVYAAYGDDVTCENVKVREPLAPAKNLKIAAKYDEKEKDLSDILVADKQCGEIWLRFVDKNGCNWRIIWIGGVPYIIP